MVRYMDPTVSKIPRIQSPIKLICIGLVKVTGMTSSEMGFRAAGYFHTQHPARCNFGMRSCKLEPGWKFSFYNVLWVEWEDSMAYRKVIGKVWAEYWDAVFTEEVVVRLG